MDSLQVWFETLRVNRGVATPLSVTVWLRHPYRMLACDLSELQRQAAAGAGANRSANRFTLQPGTYTVYRTLPPVQDCKMCVLIEEQSSPERTFSSETFFLEREEFQRIVSTARSVLSLIN